MRAFGPDADLVSRHVAAFVTGLQAGGVAACAKHFPGHGDTAVDSHLGLPVTDATPESLRRTELGPFRAAIDAGVRAIMTAHIRVRAFDRVPATLSRVLLHDLLREELGFEGLVVTDALEMRAISDTVGVEQGAVLSLVAGADALCLGHDLGSAALAAVRDAIVAAVLDGRLAEERLEEAAGRVRRATYGLEAGGSAGAEAGIGMVAARRAIHTDGEVELVAPAFVVELAPEPTIAAGKAGRGLGELLRERAPETVALVVEEDAASTAASIAAGDRQVVLVLRDADRHPWEQGAAGAVLAASPDAVVVDIGMPAGRPAGVRGYLATYGAREANLLAAIERLLPDSTSGATTRLVPAPGRRGPRR